VTGTAVTFAVLNSGGVGLTLLPLGSRPYLAVAVTLR
jgi:hypothetical protein